MSEPRDEQEPDWGLLPHDPEAFFDLDEGFDLRTLKRSYNRLLRRYKPEKFPDEFQRIRAAYEDLSDALRYNVPSQRQQRRSDETPPAETASPADSAAQHEEVPPNDAHADALPPESPEVDRPAEAQPQPQRARPEVEINPLAAATTAPEQTYEHLRSRANKSAEDYVYLALLSDVVHQREAVAGEGFADWIFTGLKRFKHDWGLTQLLREYLDESHSLDELAKLLQKSVAVLPP